MACQLPVFKYEEMQQVCGSRKFYDLQPAFDPTDDKYFLDLAINEEKHHSETEPHKDILDFIYSDVIGEKQIFKGPFGNRKVVYCDYVASGKPMKSIENYLYSQVLPFYGNTHTTTSICSLQTTLFRDEARDIIRNAVNASEHDSVIFTGSGCTGAVHKLINGLKLNVSPIVLHGPYEHHSNLLPWREISAMTIRINETDDGLLDLRMLRDELEKQKGKGLLIGCFSAASNVSGIIAEDLKITALLHDYGALAFWDYAACAPYVNIDMNPIHPDYIHRDIRKDAIFFSMHKFVGGVQTPGVLVVKKQIMKNSVPNGLGGGTVFFVTRNDHRYLKDIEMKEEGGTPAIVESIRAGVVMNLKMTVTVDVITKREKEIVSKALNAWSAIPELKILGSKTAERLSVFSFKVQHSSGRYLHHNFVSAVLNDVFGIQARGGCACAGPYAQDLLGIDEYLAKEYEKILLEDSRLDRDHLRRKEEHSGYEILRPGFCRVGIPYFFPDKMVDFVIEAVSLTAKFCWMLLPCYRLNPETGEWHHSSQLTFKNRRWLGNLRFSKYGLEINKSNDLIEDALSPEDTIHDFLSNILPNTKTHVKSVPDEKLLFDSEKKIRLRWFMIPSEAVTYLKGGHCDDFVPPFSVKDYKEAPTEFKGTSLHSTTTTSVQQAVINANATKDTGKKLNSSFILTNSTAPNNETKECNYAKQHEVIGDVVENLMEQGCFIKKEPSKLVKVVHRKRERWEYSNMSNIEKQVNSAEQRNSDESWYKSENQEIVEDSLGGLFTLSNVSNTGSSCSSNDSAIEPDVEKPDETEMSGWVFVPKNIMKPMIDSIKTHEMIKSGERVLVCVSGGKDSLTLLHALNQYKEHMKRRGFFFEIGAVTVDPGSSSYDPSSLIPYMRQLGIPYYYEKQVYTWLCKFLPPDGIVTILGTLKQAPRG
ncbi:hypothetical protein QYM36_000332 [Artemia franciscana]|uniref:Aminotransferase class V domain-containing protein n=1 Tax=Artemia franciscana TaxID=6661 RepID=A0AA88LGA9_ARTSF|nr:hypothetical protein QYM36_000332 [Artemia franciscana]